MGQACGAGVVPTEPDITFPRKRNCVLGATEEHTLDFEKLDAMHQSLKAFEKLDDACQMSGSPMMLKSLSEDSLCDEEDNGWAVGNRAVVTDEQCYIREGPSADAAPIGVLKPWMTVVLMKLVEDNGRTWAFVDPPITSKKGPSAGWAILEGEACGEHSKLQLRKLDLSWEVGRVYKGREGTILRAGSELNSARLGALKKDDKVEILELQTNEGDSKSRLRAKVLIWRTRETAWISPRSKDGFHLLKRFKVQKLEMCGRLAQTATKQKHRRGGA